MGIAWAPLNAPTTSATSRSNRTARMLCYWCAVQGSMTPCWNLGLWTALGLAVPRPPPRGASRQMAHCTASSRPRCAHFYRGLLFINCLGLFNFQDHACDAGPFRSCSGYASALPPPSPLSQCTLRPLPSPAPVPRGGGGGGGSRQVRPPSSSHSSSALALQGLTTLRARSSSSSH